MKSEHASLLARIERFQLGAPDGGQAFVQRLARENGWPIAYAQRASEEYKRFAFLALVSDHPCTPSDQVDQVWHLHLIHTQEYWQRFCGEVLRAPLHHTPSRGGPTESAKFRDWYELTLHSYRAAFGAEPPADIWPSGELRFTTRARRVDRNAFWLVPKPVARARRPRRLLLAAAFSSFALAGCTLIHAVPPFSFRGPQFLGFFIATWLGCLVVAGALRDKAKALSPRVPANMDAIDAYETAYLAGGSELVAHALIATLVEGGALQADKDRRRLVALSHPAPGAHPLELEVFRRCDDDVRGASVASLAKLVTADRGRFEPKLEQAGLIVPSAQARKWLMLALLVPVIGVIKFIVGVALHKPVGLLLILLVVSVLVSWSKFGARPTRTAAGDAELERMRQPLRAITQDEAARASLGVPIAVAVGLFGVSVLASNSALADLGAVLSPSSGGGSGCGGGDCGGGCGGGCGGCGGCGG